MSTRSRTEHLVYPAHTGTFVRSDAGVDFPSVHFDVSYPQSSEMTSTFEVASALPPKGKGTFKSWNNFEHYARSVTPERRPFRWATTRYTNFAPIQAHVSETSWPGSGWPFSTPYGSWDSPFTGLPQLYVPSPSGFTHIERDETVLRDEAFKSLLPGIRPRLSLLNSVYELKDYKTLLHTGRRLRDWNHYFNSGKWITNLKGLIPQGKKTLRRILGLGSDGYLQLQFNLLPLFSDIENTNTSLRSFTKEVARLLEGEGQRKLARLQWSLLTDYPDLDQHDSLRGYGTTVNSPGPDEGIGSMRAHRFVRYPEAVFNAQLEYSYTLTEYARQAAYLGGLLDSLGVNLNPKIIWNAIPWSFVVDWVIGVNRFLDQFESRNVKPQTIIHRWCYSYSIVRNVSLIKDIHVNSYWTVLGVPVAKHTESAYKRSNGMPNIITAITGSGLSMKEFSLAAALGGSNLR